MDADAALLKELLTSPIAYHPVFARVAGSAAAGLFLSQLYYWSQRASHPDGWVYKDAGAWHEETRLTVQEQRTARRGLARLGLLLEAPAHKFFSEISAFDKKLCFKLNIDLLHELIRNRKQQKTPSVQENAECAISTDRAEIPEDHIIVPRAGAVAECAISTDRKNKASAKNPSSREKQQFTRHRVPHRLPSTPYPSAAAKMAVVEEMGNSEILNELDEFVEAAMFSAKQAGKVIKNETHWRAAVKKRIQKSGPSSEDIADLDRLRAERRAQIAAKTVSPGTYFAPTGAKITVSNGGAVNISDQNGATRSIHISTLVADIDSGRVTLTPA